MQIGAKKVFIWGAACFLVAGLIFTMVLTVVEYQRKKADHPRRVIATATAITIVSPRPSWIEQKYADAIPATAKLEFLTPPDSSSPPHSFALISSEDSSHSTVLLPPEKPGDAGTVLTRPEMVAHYVSTVESLRTPASKQASKKTASKTGTADVPEIAAGVQGGPPGFGLRVGMTFAEVRAVLGNPRGETTDGTHTFWSYDRAPLSTRVARSAASTAAYATRSAIGVPIVGDVAGGYASESIRGSVSYHALGLDFMHGKLVKWSSTKLH
jgi:hypothetical protein